jgi:hypothetical protein
MSQKPSYIIYFFFSLYLLTLTGGCEKEYSYEGGPVQDSTIIQDSIKPVSITFPNCTSCNNTDPSATLKWSFEIGNSFLCGNITKGVLSPDHDGMTFFGPSACSYDTGLIITAMFNSKMLNEDQSNLTASSASLEYYDNTATSDILQSKRPNIFSLTIDNYTRQTGIATGTFNGSVLDRNGNIVKVDAGRFSVKF